MPRDNPFYYNLPTRPTDFVGRWPLVEEIAADLSKPRADSWAVIGGRRFGKSSVLKAVESRLMEQLPNCGQGDRHVFPLIVDLKGSETDTEQNVYARIMRLLHRALNRNRVLAVDLSRTNLDQVRSSETLSFYQFENALDDLADYFERHYGPLRLALLLDEVEVTTRFPWSETLLNQLRALIYDGPLADAVKLVLTGSARVIQVRHAGSPLLNAVKIVHLESFSDAALQELITRGGEVPDETATAVQTQSGGHPFVAQCLLHHLWDQDNGLAETTPAQVEQIAHQMRQRRAADLQGWWEAIGDSGQRAYALLVDAENWLDERVLLVQVRDTTQPLDQGLAALCYHGLAVCDESRRRYRAVGALFFDWFLQNMAGPLGRGAVERSETPSAPITRQPAGRSALTVSGASAIEELATLIRARREAGDRPYTLLLGSSLSLTTEVRQAVCGDDGWEAFWTTIQGLSAAERRALLAGPLEGLNLTAGYRCLAQLVQAGYFDLVLTLNVDDALDESLRILSAREYQILTHGQVPGTEIATALGRAHPRVKAVKLRGDINAYKLPLTPEGQFEFPEELEEAVERLLSQDTILLGDIPHDTDIQRCIRQGEGALWVVVPEEPRPGSFLFNAKKARPKGEVISGPEAEFVSFFSALARGLGVNLSAVLPVGELASLLTRGDDVLPVSSLQEPTEIHRRYALLIGVRDYVDANYRPLPHTVHDVSELARVLEEGGYTIRVLHSDQSDPVLKPTRENIWGELENLGSATGPGDLLLVHFGGHGDLSGDKAYLLPANARKASLHRTAIDLAEFRQVLFDAGAQAKILILDACHSGIGRHATGMDASFERHVHLEATGAATLAACRRGEVAYEHDASPHGAFTYYLLEGMRGASAREGGRFVTFDDLKDYVTSAVKDWAIRNGRQQWPNASTQLVGDPPLIEL